MNIDELMTMLDMESTTNFEYFEQMADLLECEKDITFEDFYAVISQAEKTTLEDLVSHYFDELTDNLPDDTSELFTIVETIKQKLVFFAQNLDRDEHKRTFAQELYAFRQWYTQIGNAEANGEPCSIFEAVTMHREEQLGGEKIDYDFTNSLQYEIEELAMPLGTFEGIDLSE